MEFTACRTHMYDNSRESNPTKMKGNGDGTRTQAFLTLKLCVFSNIYTAYLMVPLQKAPLVIDRNMSTFVPVITDPLYTSQKENSIS